ncbi:phospholipase A and acyltransferase 3 [Etheostoma spectabile]|uniref:phospholipase A and acyltransferase 3 n=1 Tax=Etheostoma spectabile TaxID=54343 RepID=UPI0013AF9162|nr:phospholipase A and acyltransferase 3-like [Etheostoma spectabile]XP_032382704.1 phospholipase A and acyltransferase 3-like [Etheostoma spectabile]
MDPAKFDAKPGDLIEISRGLYQHWALYIGDMEVVHFTAGDGDIGVEGWGKVKRENIWKVVGNDKFHVNNSLDDKYPPREIDIIVKEAIGMVGRKRWYSLSTSNCEHFVTKLRNNMAVSRQVVDEVLKALDVLTGVESFVKDVIHK